MSKEQVTFEVKPMLDEQQRFGKGIFIDGEHFDWGVDEDDFKEAVERSKKIGGQAGSLYLQSIQDSIQKHFLECLSEFMGRQVTADEVNKAHRTGVIDK